MPEVKVLTDDLLSKCIKQFPSTVEVCARALEATLREEMCESWHYSDHGSYETYDDLPDDIRDALIKGVERVLVLSGRIL